MEKRGKENATEDQFETRRCGRVGKITARCIGGKGAGDATKGDATVRIRNVQVRVGVGRSAGRGRSLGNYLQNSRIAVGRSAKMQTPRLIPRLIWGLWLLRRRNCVGAPGERCFRAGKSLESSDANAIRRRSRSPSRLYFFSDTRSTSYTIRLCTFFFFLFPDKNVMRDGNCRVRTVSCVRGANGIRNRITKL